MKIATRFYKRDNIARFMQQTISYFLQQAVLCYGNIKTAGLLEAI